MSEFQEFIGAIRREDIVKLKTLFKTEFIEEIDDGRTALHYASVCDKKGDIVKYLLCMGWNIEKPNLRMHLQREWWFKGWRSIHLATQHNLLPSVISLIEGGCSLDCVTLGGETPLDIANRLIFSQCKEIFRIVTEGWSLVDNLKQIYDLKVIEDIKASRIEKKEITDWTYLKSLLSNTEPYRLLHECLLYRCINQKYIDGFQILCTAEIVNRDSLLKGPTSLECAVESAVKMWVEFILKKLIRVDESWTRAEIIASTNMRVDISEMIASRKAYLNNRKERGYSRLHIAVYDNDCDTIEYILKNDLVDADDADKLATFESALMLAHDLGYMECVHSFNGYNEKNINATSLCTSNPKLLESELVTLCHICEDEPKNVAFNCGHIFCVTCAEKTSIGKRLVMSTF